MEKSIIFQHLAKSGQSYRHEIYSYYGWSWSNSAFYNIIVVLACFEILIFDSASAFESLKRGTEIMQTALRPDLANYDPSIIDSLSTRRRRKDLHSLQLFGIKLFGAHGIVQNDAAGNLIKFRQLISSALSNFPSCPKFLFCWMKVEAQKLGIHQPSDNLLQVNSSLMRRLFSILYDLTRETRMADIRWGNTFGEKYRSSKL